MKPCPNEIVFRFKIVYRLCLTMIRFRKSKKKIFNASESHFERSKTKKSDDARYHPMYRETLRNGMTIWTKIQKITKCVFANLKSLRIKPPPN